MIADFFFSWVDGILHETHFLQRNLGSSGCFPYRTEILSERNNNRFENDVRVSLIEIQHSIKF